jgi:ABC-2 type transport system ATP-binding protein
MDAAEFRKIGYVSENQELPGWMTLRQFLDYCAPLYPTWDAAFAEDLRRRLDLASDRRIRDFSRGMRMKAALLSSLAFRPRLLVLDEPFAGLDALVRDEMIQGVLELAEQSQWTVFLSSHDIREVERLADWIGIINEGRLHLAEPVASILARCRQVEVTFADPAALPAPLPSAWLDVQTTGRVLRFVDTACNGVDDEARLRQALPAAVSITDTPVSLEAIFVAMARGFRGARAAGAPLRPGEVRS